MEFTKEIQIPPQYEQIGRVVEQYKNVICNKFRTQEAALLEELEKKAKRLKENIAFYKKQTSKENVQKLISKKRHDKEVERLELELKWRNLMETYKKLQQQQKRVNEQNKQSLFDLENLRNKIQQLRNQNQSLDRKIAQLKEKITTPQFLTEAKVQTYSSPYKIQPSRIARSLQRRSTNFSKQSQRMKKSILKLKDNIRHDKENFVHSQFKPKKNKINVLRLNKKLQINKFLGQQPKFKGLLSSQKDVLSKQTSPSFKKNQKWQQLKYYLDKPEIKDKIFQLLRK